MFSGRNIKKDKPAARKKLPGGLGIFDTSVDFNLNDGDSDASDGHDSDLEAELAAIAAGTSKQTKRPKPKPQANISDLDRMVAESLKDVDEDMDDDDDDDNPDLLNELSEIADSSPVAEQMEVLQATSTAEYSQQAMLTARIDMYNTAIANAKQAEDNSRARRFERGLKTLNTMLKQVNAGRPIDVNDIPPEIVVKPSTKPVEVPVDPPSVPVRAAPLPPTLAEDIFMPDVVPPRSDPPVAEPAKKPINEAIINKLLERQREYKIAAINAKKAQDLEKAKNFVKIIKIFDTVLVAARDGQDVDLSDMPPPPDELRAEMMAAAPEPLEPKREEAENQNSAAQQVDDAPPPVAATIMESLMQRLDKYKSVEKAAKDEDNTSKARRFGRIIKQYEDAIKLHKAGKPVPFDELPTPPGFGPIPINNDGAPASALSRNDPVAVPKLPAAPTAQPSTSTNESNSAATSPPQRPSRTEDPASRLSGNHSSTTLMNKTIATIIERQKEYRNAAVLAKKANEIDEAKEYLRIYKGLENLLDTAKGGLPIDLSTLPISPSQRANLEDSFTVVSESDCATDDLSNIGNRLEEQLLKQLTMCKVTRDHNRAMGDVAGTNRFENLAISVQKDYDIIKIARRNNLPLPKFHYEQRQFNIVKCNTDLTESELEIEVARGIGYGVANPKDVDTYVKLEFPYPQDAPFKARTQTIRDTDNPEYNEKFTVEIHPKMRPCQRVFKRHSLKLEVFSKGYDWRVAQCCESICCFSGFLRSDILIGTVLVKLQPLETSCEIHDSYNLMDGRKTVGGKLEVKIRTRNPILTKQIEHIKEKWLIIDT